MTCFVRLIACLVYYCDILRKFGRAKQQMSVFLTTVPTEVRNRQHKRRIPTAVVHMAVANFPISVTRRYVTAAGRLSQNRTFVIFFAQVLGTGLS